MCAFLPVVWSQSHPQQAPTTAVGTAAEGEGLTAAPQVALMPPDPPTPSCRTRRQSQCCEARWYPTWSGRRGEVWVQQLPLPLPAMQLQPPRGPLPPRPAPWHQRAQRTSRTAWTPPPTLLHRVAVCVHSTALDGPSLGWVWSPWLLPLCSVLCRRGVIGEVSQNTAGRADDDEEDGSQRRRGRVSWRQRCGLGCFPGQAGRMCHGLSPWYTCLRVRVCSLACPGPVRGWVSV